MKVERQTVAEHITAADPIGHRGYTEITCTDENNLMLFHGLIELPSHAEPADYRKAEAALSAAARAIGLEI